MKKALILTATAVLLAGCASRENTSSNNSGGIGPSGTVSGTEYATEKGPNQQGSGAAALTSGSGNTPNYTQSEVQSMSSAQSAGTYPVAGAPTPMAGATAAGTAAATTDAAFIQRAADHAQAQIKLGNLLVQNGQSQAVKNYGQRLIDDNTRLMQGLSPLASQKGVTLPTSLDPRHQKELDHLASMSGTDFDKRAARDAVSSNEHDLRMYQDVANNSSDPDVKSFANQQIPLLQQELDSAKQLESQVSGS